MNSQQLAALFSQVKNCGTTDAEQKEYLHLWLDELEEDDRAVVQQLIDNGKTVLEAINSFRGRRNGKQCYLLC